MPIWFTVWLSKAFLINMNNCPFQESVEYFTEKEANPILIEKWLRGLSICDIINSSAKEGVRESEIVKSIGALWNLTYEHAQIVVDNRIRREMRPIKVTFENGNVITTQINGSKNEINDYYIGNEFEVGGYSDAILREKPTKAIKVEYLE